MNVQLKPEVDIHHKKTHVLFFSHSQTFPVLGQFQLNLCLFAKRQNNETNLTKTGKVYLYLMSDVEKKKHVFLCSVHKLLASTVIVFFNVFTV